MRLSMLLKASLLAAALGLPAAAQEGSLLIDHPYVAATLPGVTSAAGYFSVKNTSGEDDSLLAVRAGFAEASVHASVTNDAGVTSMAPVARLPIPAHETVTLEPRGLHVMFVGIKTPLAAGETLPVTLVFEKAGDVAVTFDVEARGAGAAGMGAHDMGAQDMGGQGMEGMPMDHKAMGH